MTSAPKHSFPDPDEISDAIASANGHIDRDFSAIFGNKRSTTANDGWLLLQQLFDLHFRPSQLIDPFGPMMTTKDGQRSMIPDDLSDEQLDELQRTLDKVKDSEYKARIGDVLWIRRKDAKAARIAVAAYLEAAIRVEDLTHWPPSMKRYERAIRLARQIDPKGELPRSALAHLENRVRHYDGDDPSFFTCKALELLAEFRYGDFAILAEIAGRVAQKSRGDGDFRRARHYYEVQAKHLKLAKEPDRAEAAYVAAAHTFVEEAESRESKNEFMAAHSFWGDAIAAFRDRPSLRGQSPELQRRYSAAGEKLRGEMHTISTDPVDISEFVEASRAAVRGLSWDDAFFELVSFVPLIDPSQLRKSTEEAIASYPIHATVAASIYDASGRKIGVRPSVITSDRVEYERAMIGLMEQDANLHRSLMIHGHIAPALRQIGEDHAVDRALVANVLHDSALIPDERRDLFYQAFAAGFQWDFSTALHILIPQVENGLRYVLEQQGVSPVNIDPGGVEEVWGYERILGHPKTQEILEDELIFELKSLLVERLGSNFRHLFAHGALSPDGFRGEIAVYLWWVLLRLAASPTSGMYAFFQRKEAAIADSPSK